MSAKISRKAYSIGIVIAALAVPITFFGIKQYDENKQQNLKTAKRCIEVHNTDSIKGSTKTCEKVKIGYLPDELKPSFEAAFAKNETAKAAEAAQAKLERQRALQKLEEQQAKRLAERRAKEAAFKAEGWWEQTPGIFVRWCGSGNPPCPGPTSNGYSDYIWRMMVWCKERACGDIYAKINIEQQGTVVGWTNATAYGAYGKKVVIMFGSSLHGSANLVQFSARP